MRILVPDIRRCEKEENCLGAGLFKVDVFFSGGAKRKGLLMG